MVIVPDLLNLLFRQILELKVNGHPIARDKEYFIIKGSLSTSNRAGCAHLLTSFMIAHDVNNNLS